MNGNATFRIRCFPIDRSDFVSFYIRDYFFVDYSDFVSFCIYDLQDWDNPS